jgi:hypothetical protein
MARASALEKVTVYYTEEAGHKIAHCFKKGVQGLQAEN